MKKLLPFLFSITVLIFVAGCSIAPSVANPPVESGITLSKCLAHNDSEWLETEDFFTENIMPDISPEYELYDASELSAEIIENRNGRVIVERCIGFVTNKVNGDGRVLNAYDIDYDYISYRSADQTYSDGTVFITYMIYNPTTNYIDDIAERYDYVLCREYED